MTEALLDLQELDMLHRPTLPFLFKGEDPLDKTPCSRENAESIKNVKPENSL